MYQYTATKAYLKHNYRIELIITLDQIYYELYYYIHIHDNISGQSDILSPDQYYQYLESLLYKYADQYNRNTLKDGKKSSIETLFKHYIYRLLGKEQRQQLIDIYGLNLTNNFLDLNENNDQVYQIKAPWNNNELILANPLLNIVRSKWSETIFLFMEIQKNFSKYHCINNNFNNFQDNSLYMKWCTSMDWFSHCYSYCIPNLFIINKIANYKPLVDAAAGLGYWSHLLQSYAIDIIPFDKHPTHIQYNHDHGLFHNFTTIAQADINDIFDQDLKLSIRTLLLIYPTMKYALTSIQKYKGDYIIYIGHVLYDHQYIANDFMTYLQQHFIQIDQTYQIPSFFHQSYICSIWKRKKISKRDQQQRQDQQQPRDEQEETVNQQQEEQQLQEEQQQQSYPLASCIKCNADYQPNSNFKMFKYDTSFIALKNVI